MASVRSSACLDLKKKTIFALELSKSAMIGATDIIIIIITFICVVRCAARRSMTSRDRNKSCAPHKRISLHTPLVHVRRSSDRHAGVRACNYIRYTYTTGTRRSSGCTWGFFFFREEAKMEEKKTAVVVVVGDEECAKLLGQLTAIRRRRRRNSSHRKILNNIQCLQNILVFVSVQTQ